VSATATVELVATTVPVVDPVRKLARNDSAPSVVTSFARITAKEPELLVIVTEPPDVTAFAGELKSALLIVPVTPARVQYKVPDPKFAVVTVNVTVAPSFTEVEFGASEYVGAREVSATVTVELVATTDPAVEVVRKRAKKDSVPSVVTSLARVTVNEPELLVIATEPPDVTAFAGELKSALLTVPDTPSSVQ
jgi:hypothetical protein